MDQVPGQIIAGKFRLEKRIGLGSMGSVWGARHLALDAPVALKFMSPLLAGDRVALSRFEREAQAAARIRSPHVVQVLDHGIDEGTPFMVMEWLEGEDLGARLRRLGRLSLPDTAALALQACKALRAAHEAGVIHRDLKPSNIFITRSSGEEIIKLLDFGVAKVVLGPERPAAEATATGALVGTPDYMSPEQIRGSKQLDHRSDLWSLGVILYQVLTGRKPFSGESLGDVIMKICTAPIQPPSTLVLELPPAVDWFFDVAIARDPARRFQSAADLSAAFAALAQGRPAPGPGEVPQSARAPGGPSSVRDLGSAPSARDPGGPSSVRDLGDAATVRDVGAPASHPAALPPAAPPLVAPVTYLRPAGPGPERKGSSLVPLMVALIVLLLAILLWREPFRALLRSLQQGF